MAVLVQSITMRVEANNEQALEEVKRLKSFLGDRGVSVRAFWAIEAGMESGLATIAMEFPTAAAWAALVDSESSELQAMRRRGAEHPGVVVNSQLLQEIDLS